LQIEETRGKFFVDEARLVASCWDGRKDFGIEASERDYARYGQHEFSYHICRLQVTNEAFYLCKHGSN